MDFHVAPLAQALEQSKPVNRSTSSRYTDDDAQILLLFCNHCSEFRTRIGRNCLSPQKSIGIISYGIIDSAGRTADSATVEDDIMDNPGQKLKRARERLKLRYRDVEEASQRIADEHANAEYGIALSRLSDIENKGTVPTIF